MIEILPAEILQSPPIEHHYTVDKEVSYLNPFVGASFDIPLHSIAHEHLSTMKKSEMDADWKLNEFFGSIYVINLPKATERLEKITKRLGAIGVTHFEVFTGVDGRKEVDETIWRKFYCNRDYELVDNTTIQGAIALAKLHKGEAGCYLSHYRLISSVNDAFRNALEEFNKAKLQGDPKKVKKALKKVRKFSRVMIMEDDCGFGFIKDQNVITKGAGVSLRKALLEVPDKWDMLYFVVGILEPTKKMSEHIYKLGCSWSLAGYAVNYTMYQTLVNHLKRIEDPLVTWILPVDGEIGNIHYLHNVYGICPSLCFHDIGDSQISAVRGTTKYWQGQPNEAPPPQN